MKAIIILAGLILPICTLAQIDKFTGQLKTETKAYLIASNAQMKISSVDSTDFLIMEGYGKGVGLIREDDELIFLLADGSQVKLLPVGFQDYNVALGGTSYRHRYFLTSPDRARLASGTITDIRKHTQQGYSDYQVKPKHQVGLQNLFKEKQNGTPKKKLSPPL